MNKKPWKKLKIKKRRVAPYHFEDLAVADIDWFKDVKLSQKDRNIIECSANEV